MNIDPAHKKICLLWLRCRFRFGNPDVECVLRSCGLMTEKADQTYAKGPTYKKLWYCEETGVWEKTKYSFVRHRLLAFH